MLERGFLSRILFPAPVPSYSEESFPEELIWVPRSKDFDGSSPPPPDADSMPCLLLTYPSARFLIIFFHSNAEDLGRCRGFCCYLREQFQVHVLAVEYPGYGICPGVPTGETVMENAFAAVRFARGALHWPLDSIKVFGRSIGTGPAVGLASCFSFAGLILVTPFLSVQELFRDRVGPLAGLVEEWFCNEDGAKNISSPTIIIHGQRDELITCRHGESLFKILNCRKMLVSPPDMEHNTNLLTNLQIFVLPMFQFFALPDYVFQDMRVPAWAYSRPPPAGPSEEFEACAEEYSRLDLHEDGRPRAASAPRRLAAEYAATPAPALAAAGRARSSSASPASSRPSPRKPLATVECEQALAAEAREQRLQRRAMPPLSGPRPNMAPPLSCIAGPVALPVPMEPEDPEDELPGGRCFTRNLAMDLMPEDPCPRHDLIADLVSSPEALLGTPRAAGCIEEPAGALGLDLTAAFEGTPEAAQKAEETMQAEETATSAGQGRQPSASSTAPLGGRAARGSASDGLPSRSGAGLGFVTSDETEEAISRLTEFAGTMCDRESCSDRLVGDGSPGDRPREPTRHEELLAAIAEQGSNFAQFGPMPDSGGDSEPQVDTRPPLLSAEAIAAARQRGRGVSEDSVWTRWCGRSGPGLDLHEAKDGPAAPRQAPLPRERPSRPRDGGELGRDPRRSFTPTPLVSSCCRGLPIEGANDLLSPKRAGGSVLPTDEELLEHLRPAAFLLPRRKRLSI